MGLRRALASAVFASALVARTASASHDLDRVQSASLCELDRSPVLLSLALPPALECEFDEDGNGLDDEVEEQLARCVVPQLRFDPHENARRPDEPHVLFNAYRVAPDRLRVHFAILFAKDGGFVDGGASCYAADAHPGDSEHLVLDVKLVEHDGKYSAYASRLDTGEDVTFVDAEPRMTLDGTHPVVWPSAGKHHLHQPAGTYTFDVRGPGVCDVPARGGGDEVIPTTIGHVPNFHPATEDGQPARSTTPLVEGGARWANACRFARHGVLEPAVHLRANRLDDLGYAGDAVEGHEFFCGGAPGGCSSSPVAETMAFDGDFTTDVDGDGLDDMDGIAWTEGGAPARTYTFRDPCPLSRQHGPDLEGDGIPEACDPDPSSRQLFIAGARSRGFAFSPLPSAIAAALGGARAPHPGFFELDRPLRSRPSLVVQLPAEVYGVTSLLGAGSPVVSGRAVR